MINISVDKLAEIIQKAGDEKYGVNDFYFIGQYEDGRYYGVLSNKVKSRSSAAQLRRPDFLEQKGLKVIKVIKRKKG